MCTSHKGKRLQFKYMRNMVLYNKERRTNSREKNKRQRRVPAIEREKREWTINFICLAAQILIFFLVLCKHVRTCTNGFLIIFSFSLVKCFCWFRFFLCAHLERGWQEEDEDGEDESWNIVAVRKSLNSLCVIC